MGEPGGSSGGREYDNRLQRVGVDEFHEDAVPRLIHRAGDGEVVFVEDLQEGKSVRPSGPQCWPAVCPGRTFMKAYSFSAASRDIYIHDADFRLPM